MWGEEASDKHTQQHKLGWTWVFYGTLVRDPRREMLRMRLTDGMLVELWGVVMDLLECSGYSQPPEDRIMGSALKFENGSPELESLPKHQNPNQDLRANVR